MSIDPSAACPSFALPTIGAGGATVLAQCVRPATRAELMLANASQASDTTGGTVSVNATAANASERGKIKQFGWFGTHHNYVFLDENGDGKRQPTEAGIPDQVINLRYRDGWEWLLTREPTKEEAALEMEGWRECQ